MSGGGGNTTTTQKADPWGPVQPYLQSVFSNANSLSASGGPNLNTGQVAQNGNLDQALASIYGSGINGYSAGSPTLGQAVGQTSQLARGDYSNLQGGLTLQNLAGGNFNIDPVTGTLSNVAQGNTAGTGAYDTLNRYGQGQFSGTPQGDNLVAMSTGNFTGSPAGQQLTDLSKGNYTGAYGILNGMANGNFNGTGLDQLTKTSNGFYTNPNNSAVTGLFNAQAQPLTQQFQQSTLPGLLSAYSAAGRYGSGANDTAINSASSALGQTLSNLSQSTIGTNYANERANQQAAAGQLAGYQTGAASNLAGMTQNASNTLLGAQGTAASGLLNAQTGAASNMAGIQSQLGQYLASLRSGAAGTIAGIQGSAISALPGMAGQQSSDQWNALSNALTAAQGQQQVQQGTLNSGIAQQNQNAQAPYDNLSWLNGILSGASAYKVGTSTAPASGGGLLGGLGGALAGSSLGGAVGGTGSFLGLGGSQLGAIGGGLLGVL